MAAERRYPRPPKPKARGGRWEELPHIPMTEARGRGGRSHPTPEAKGGGWQDQPHIQGAVAARAQEGLEELSHVEGQERQW